MKKKTTFGLSVILIALAATVCTGCKKDEILTTGIKMTTTIAAGETIKLLIIANRDDQDDVWIDLNNNGKRDIGDNVIFSKDFTEYTLGSQTITLHGKITMLYCKNSQLTTLDLSKNTTLSYLDCSTNQLTSLDISTNRSLIESNCSYNQLTTLDVSKNTALEYLLCQSNQLTSLDVSKNTYLRDLFCQSNKLTSLYVSKNTILTRLYFDNNRIKADAMTKLVEGLPTYSNGVRGLLRPRGGENEFSTAHEAAAKKKNWDVTIY